MTVYNIHIQTPLGICKISGSEKGIESISILDEEIAVTNKV